MTVVVYERHHGAGRVPQWIVLLCRAVLSVVSFGAFPPKSAGGAK